MIGAEQATHEEELADRAAMLLAAAILRRAVMDVEQGHHRAAALAYLAGDGAELAALALKVPRAAWLRRIEELARQHEGWERGRRRRGLATLMAAAA